MYPRGPFLALCCFLFTLMNDLPNASEVFEFISFADDTDLFSTIEYSTPITRTNINETLNSELSEVHDWLTLNKLTLNITKTKSMVFHPIQNDITMLILVILDENLSWKSQTNILSNKMSKYTAISNRLKLSASVCYENTVLQHGGVSLKLWATNMGGACSRLTKIQKRVIQTITRSK